MQQQSRARQVLEETQPQARAIRRPLDQARHVGHDEMLMLAELHHTEVGHQGGERVIGHLGLGRRDRADQGRLAGIGHAQQTDIRHHLHLEAQVATLALGTRRGTPRRPVGRGLEVNVAEPATTALGHEHHLPSLGHIGNHLEGVLVDHRGAHRHLDVQVLAGAPAHLPALPRLAVLSLVEALVLEVDEGIQASSPIR